MIIGDRLRVLGGFRGVMGDALLPATDAAISVPGIIHNYSLVSQSKSVTLTSSLSATFEQVRLRMAAHATGEAWALVPRGEKPLFLPEPFPGSHSPTLFLTPPLPIAATPKVDLSRVQLP